MYIYNACMVVLYSERFAVRASVLAIVQARVGWSRGRPGEQISKQLLRVQLVGVYRVYIESISGVYLAHSWLT